MLERNQSEVLTEIARIPERAGCDTDVILGQAIVCGDVVEASREKVVFSPGEFLIKYIGADRLSKQQEEEAKRSAQAELERLAAEAEKAEKERERVERIIKQQEEQFALWYKELNDRQSEASRTIVVMPFADKLPRKSGEDNLDAAQTWVAEHLRIRLDWKTEIRIDNWGLAGRILHVAQDLGYLGYSEERDCHYGVKCKEVLKEAA